MVKVRGKFQWDIYTRTSSAKDMKELIESFSWTFFLDDRKPLETTWPTSSGQVTRLRFTFLLLERLLEVSELRWTFYVTFTQPTHVWGANLYSYMSVVLESQRFGIEHWSTCQFLVNTYERLKTTHGGYQQVQNTNANLNALWHVNIKLLTANVWPRFAVCGYQK